MASYLQHKDTIQARLRRIEGQVRGLQKMIDEEKYCVDVLTQVSSVTAALQKVGVIILEDHINGCVRNALADEEQAVAQAVETHRVAQRLDDRVLGDDSGEGLRPPAAIERLVLAKLGRLSGRLGECLGH